MKTCAVTGASGLIGSHLVKHLSQLGYKTIPLRRPEFELGKSIDPQALNGVSILIHSAYDFRAKDWKEILEKNVQGSEKLFRQAREAGVEKIVFVSSCAAFENCKSMYGRGKLLVEKFVLEMGGGIVVRPGFVYGDPTRGMYGTFTKMVRLPFLPVFDGGNQRMAMVHIEDLVAGIVELTQQKQSCVFTLAHPELISLKEILNKIAQDSGRKVKFLSVPGSFGIGALKAIEALGIGVGFRSDSLVSLLHTNPDLDFQNTEKLGVHFRSFLDKVGSPL